MKFSENLKYIRQKKRISQVALAEEVGISERMLQKYEAGIAFPRITVADNLARALQVPIDELVGGYKPRMSKKAMNEEIDEFSKRIAKGFESGKVSEANMERTIKTIVKAYSNKTGKKSIKV